MKTTYRNINLNGTKEQIAWFWSLTALERKTVARGVKRHGLTKEYERQQQLIKNRVHRLSGKMSSSEFDAFKYLETKLASMN